MKEKNNKKYENRTLNQKRIRYTYVNIWTTNQHYAKCKSARFLHYTREPNNNNTTTEKATPIHGTKMKFI